MKEEKQVKDGFAYWLVIGIIVALTGYLVIGFFMK